MWIEKLEVYKCVYWNYPAQKIHGITTLMNGKLFLVELGNTPHQEIEYVQS